MSVRGNRGKYNLPFCYNPANLSHFENLKNLCFYCSIKKAEYRYLPVCVRFSILFFYESPLLHCTFLESFLVWAIDCKIRYTPGNRSFHVGSLAEGNEMKRIGMSVSYS